MKVTRSVGVAATFAAVAVGAASPAYAVPEMSGHYVETETAANDRSASDDWYFTPCGDGCESVARKGVKAFGQANLVGGQWVLDVASEAAACPDNSQVPNALSAHYTWDPNTLAGTVQTTADVAECGDPAGSQVTDPMQLRKA
jgi:hypothetical protein